MNLRDRLQELSHTELVRRLVLGAVLGEPPCRRVIPKLPGSLLGRRTRDEGDSPTSTTAPRPAPDEKR